ncbi:aldehyde dehydrogenase family protein [Mycolicibacterium holsaticum]|uniref:aldehyde dehydrogenase family protein n=1 Tax=Mycolicibacterium holsaticum TaxID=152142 RepID=UPI001C7D55BB|nr:aldehyde dehydrogenase family protein [Mycolicibacterium holsaticum]MDA4108513.1 aldehyde dehydrogenase [Mycolicibacterium holsaticum DSM 44478 = JCM 12374]QZA12741.1 aldehyde dehydrogenase family protein [Mycolicibacterium holsaticum DSM 44478 = JCM 12374]UNC09785.1 aldehyde dehydrogenase family protein [Mycolicibacterium holsaticum DSM 44478 = JCM 12374]
MTIGGKPVESAGRFDVFDPATAQPIAVAPACTPDQLDDAMDAAEVALPDWSANLETRRELLAEVAAALEGAATDLAVVLTAEQGKPLKQARYEFTAAAQWFRYYAELVQKPDVFDDDDTGAVEGNYKPLGVVAAITPWNFPILLASWKLAPALAAGNTVVLKPSPFTPVATLAMGELLREVLPPGVLNVISGDGALGAQMTAHPAVRKISFTGSVATGKKVAAAAAADLKHATLELGGNDAAIALDDADPDAIADKLFWGAMMNCGQACSAIKRLYVPARRVDAYFDALADRARTVRVGPGAERSSQLGPVNNAAQHQRVIDLVADAVAHGARTVSGNAPETGYFQPVTVLAGVGDGVRIVDEEQFGPALPVIGYTDEEQALQCANNTSFGLSGSVWSADPERAETLARRLECGTAWVNQHLVLAPHIPFGGVKHSGVGVENGSLGLREFTRLQIIWRAAPANTQK